VETLLISSIVNGTARENPFRGHPASGAKARHHVGPRDHTVAHRVPLDVAEHGSQVRPIERAGEVLSLPDMAGHALPAIESGGIAPVCVGQDQWQGHSQLGDQMAGREAIAGQRTLMENRVLAKGFMGRLARRLDTAEATQKLGYKGKIDLATGKTRAVRWCRKTAGKQPLAGQFEF
jgi:nucleoside-diphosphate-sugar epimerase